MTAFHKLDCQAYAVDDGRFHMDLVNLLSSVVCTI